MPYEIDGSGQATVVVSYNGRPASTRNVNVIDAVLGIFSAGSSGSGSGAILNADHSLNAPAKPAAAGCVVVIYATGGCQTNLPATSGMVTAAAAPLVDNVSVTVGDRPVPCR